MAELINDLRLSYGLRIQKAERPELKNRLIWKAPHSNRKDTNDFSDFQIGSAKNIRLLRGEKFGPAFSKAFFIDFYEFCARPSASWQTFCGQNQKSSKTFLQQLQCIL